MMQFQGAFLRITKEWKKNISKTLAFHRAITNFVQPGKIIYYYIFHVHNFEVFTIWLKCGFIQLVIYILQPLGCVMAVIKRSYNNQWTFTSAVHPLSGHDIDASTDEIISFVKQNVSP